MSLFPNYATSGGSGAGSGTVIGPGSSTAGAIVIFSDAGGVNVANSAWIVNAQVLNTLDNATVNAAAATASTLRGSNKTGAAGTSGAGGDFTLQAGSATGAASTGNGGTLNLSGGTTIGGTAGAVNIKVAGATVLSARAAGTGVDVTGTLTATAFVSSTANPAAAGMIRLANADSVNFRNVGNAADITLKPSATGDGFLAYNAVDLVGASLTQTLTNKTINAATNTFVGRDAPFSRINTTIGATVAANALTVNILTQTGGTPSGTDKIIAAFRNVTLTNGTFLTRTLAAAASIIVPSGATLGQVSAQPEYTYVYLLDNAGTLEPAVSSSKIWDENILQSTTAITAGATSRFLLYSTTLRSNVPVRYIGRVRSTQAAAGTWATAPSEISSTLIEPITDRSELVLTTGNGMGSTSTKIRRYTTTETNTGSSISYPGDSATLGAEITILKEGVYSMTVVDAQAVGNCGIGLSLNSNQLTTAIETITASARLCHVVITNNVDGTATVVRRLIVGDVIRSHIGGLPDGTTLTKFSITRLGD